MLSFSITVLGAPAISVNGVPLRVLTRKATALLVYLAVERGLHSRDALVDLLWPDSSPGRGRAMLRSTLAWVRQGCAACAPLADEPFISRQQFVGLRADLFIELDTARLETALRAVRQRPQQPELLALASATESYRGDFLTGLGLPDAPSYEEWTATQAERWHQTQEEALRLLTYTWEMRGDREGALAAARRWVSHAPFSEPAHRALIALHLARGERIAAYHALERCRTVLRDELGLDPEPETLALLAHQPHQQSPHSSPRPDHSRRQAIAHTTLQSRY